METQAALIRTDGAVELHPVPLVDLYFALIVYPGNAEHDHPFRLDKAFQKPRLFILRVGFDRRFEAVQHFRCRLMKFRFVRILLFDASKHVFYIRHTEKLLYFYFHILF